MFFIPKRALQRQRPNSPKFWACGVMAIAFALFAWGCDVELSGAPQTSSAPPASAQRQGPPRVGFPAPDFTLLDMEGNTVSMSDLKGKGVLLNFWATWCGPCRVEMPGMEDVYREFNKKGFEILAISTDPQGTVVTKPFQKSYGLTFPILHDSQYEVGTIYGIRTLPMSYLVDRQGVIQHRIFGARDWNSPKARTLILDLLNM